MHTRKPAPAREIVHTRKIVAHKEARTHKEDRKHKKDHAHKEDPKLNRDDHQATSSYRLYANRQLRKHGHHLYQASNLLPLRHRAIRRYLKRQMKELIPRHSKTKVRRAKKAGQKLQKALHQHLHRFPHFTSFGHRSSDFPQRTCDRAKKFVRGFRGH